MKIIRVSGTLVALLITFPCVAEEPFKLNPGYPPPRFEFAIKDNPQDRRFDLILVSHDDRPICISHGGWPDGSGHVNWGSRDVKIESRGSVFPSRDWDFGYCAGECMTQIPAHGTLEGFINYEEFGDPSQIAELPDKRLTFETFVHLCTSPKKPLLRRESQHRAVKRAAKRVADSGASSTSSGSEQKKTYREIVESKLFLTRADCARLSLRSLSKPEKALSVYSQRRSRSIGRRSYYLTITEASKSIYQAVQENDMRTIAVDRRTAPIPQRTAVVLKGLWKKLLAHANPSDAPPQFSVDGEAIEFSLDAAPCPVSMDEIPLVGKEESVALEQLRDLLMKYCTTESSERAVLARRIREDAKGLANKF
jgi:hypothetical protein